MQILASLRLIVATDMAFDALGAVPCGFVEETIIPDLSARMNRSEPDRAAELQDLINEYRTAIDKRPNDFGRLVDQLVGGYGRNIGKTEVEVKDSASDMVSYFYTGTHPWVKDFDKFRIEDGPEALLRYWNKMLNFRVRQYWRTKGREDTSKVLRDRADLPESVIQEEFNDRFMELERELKAYIHQKMQDPVADMVLEHYFDAAEEVGATNVRFSSHVVKPIAQKLQDMGTPMAGPQHKLKVIWDNIRPLVIQFLEEEFGYNFSNAQKARLLAASVQERVALCYERTLIARCILGLAV